jgi:hypothetical protein
MWVTTEPHSRQPHSWLDPNMVVRLGAPMVLTKHVLRSWLPQRDADAPGWTALRKFCTTQSYVPNLRWESRCCRWGKEEPARHVFVGGGRVLVTFRGSMTLTNVFLQQKVPSWKNFWMASGTFRPLFRMSLCGSFCFVSLARALLGLLLAVSCQIVSLGRASQFVGVVLQNENRRFEDEVQPARCCRRSAVSLSIVWRPLKSAIWQLSLRSCRSSKELRSSRTRSTEISESHTR